MEIKQFAHSQAALLSPSRKNELTNLRRLFWDEAGIIGENLFTYVDWFFRYVKDKPDIKFGGVIVYLFLDCCQLTPENFLYRRGQRDINGKGIPKAPQLCVTSTSFTGFSGEQAKVLALGIALRQNNQPFIDAMNGIRFGEPTDANLDFLSGCGSGISLDAIDVARQANVRYYWDANQQQKRKNSKGLLIAPERMNPGVDPANPSWDAKRNPSARFVEADPDMSCVHVCHTPEDALSKENSIIESLDSTVKVLSVLGKFSLSSGELSVSGAGDEDFVGALASFRTTLPCNAVVNLPHDAAHHRLTMKLFKGMIVQLLLEIPALGISADSLVEVISVQEEEVTVAGSIAEVVSVTVSPVVSVGARKFAILKPADFTSTFKADNVGVELKVVVTRFPFQPFVACMPECVQRATLTTDGCPLRVIHSTPFSMKAALKVLFVCTQSKQVRDYENVICDGLRRENVALTKYQPRYQYRLTNGHSPGKWFDSYEDLNADARKHNVSWEAMTSLKDFMDKESDHRFDGFYLCVGMPCMLLVDAGEGFSKCSVVEVVSCHSDYVIVRSRVNRALTVRLDMYEFSHTPPCPTGVEFTIAQLPVVQLLARTFYGLQALTLDCQIVVDNSRVGGNKDWAVRGWVYMVFSRAVSPSLIRFVHALKRSEIKADPLAVAWTKYHEGHAGGVAHCRINYIYTKQPNSHLVVMRTNDVVVSDQGATHICSAAVHPFVTVPLRRRDGARRLRHSIRRLPRAIAVGNASGFSSSEVIISHLRVSSRLFYLISLICVSRRFPV
jgi:hypothetical protein